MCGASESRESSTSESLTDEAEDQVSIEKHEIKEWNKILKILKQSSLQIQLMNSAMLNLTLIKQDKFTPSPEQV